jgi:membrane protein DedA with SNARE-associated domain
MTLEALLDQYGYAAVFIGAILEGETVLLIAAVFVQQGLFDFRGLLLASALGAFVGDQCFFHLGRLKGSRFLHHYPAWQRKMDQAARMLARRGKVVILFYRFIYGMRAVIPFLLGAGRCRVVLFTLLSTVSAAAWALLIGSGAYCFGEAFASMLAKSRAMQQGGILGLLLIVITAASLYRWWKRRSTRSPE